jgi:hypothetical protein
MALKRSWNRERIARWAFVGLALACLLPVIVRTLVSDRGPFVDIEFSEGTTRTVSLQDMKAGDVLRRQGEYQNQYGNWRDPGVYAGVLVSTLLEAGDYSAVEVVAEDGYRMTIERERIENPEYPLVLAFSMDGIDAPQWEDGFRIAVLPEDGRVSNEEYDAISAGSYWVKNVVQLIVLP